MAASCQNLMHTTNALVIPVISLAGVLLNALCILVFAQIIRNEKRLNGGHMFKYLLVKSIYDCIQFVIHLYAPFYYCQQCPLTYQTLWSQVWYVWFYYYFESIVELCSGLLELAATIDCYFSLRKRTHWTQSNWFFYFVNSGALVGSTVFYLFRFYDLKIVRQVQTGSRIKEHSLVYLELNTTELLFSQEQITIEYYLVEHTAFSKTFTSKVFSVVHTMLRDAFCAVMLIIFNSMILSTLKRSVERKRNMMAINSSNSSCATKEENNEDSDLQRSNFRMSFRRSKMRFAERAERRTTIMVILTGVNYVIGHFPSILYYMSHELKHTPTWDCLHNVILVLFYSTYAVPFFLYFSFNSLFRSYFKKAFSSLCWTWMLLKRKEPLSRLSYERPADQTKV